MKQTKKKNIITNDSKHDKKVNSKQQTEPEIAHKVKSYQESILVILTIHAISKKRAALDGCSHTVQ